MFLKNATLFRFPAAPFAHFAQAAEGGIGTKLDAALALVPLKPLGPLELSTAGFVSPTGDDRLTTTAGDAVLLALAGETKIIPPAAVNGLLAKKMAEFEEREGRRPGGRTRKRIKDELITDLLPKALVKPTRVYAILNLREGYIAVDTASRKVAEGFVSHLRLALGSFPALPLNAETAPRSVLTALIADGDMPEGVALGGEAELRDPVDNGGVAKLRNHELTGEEVQSHLDSGKQVVRLSLSLDDRIGFTLDESLTLRKIELFDVALDALVDADPESLAEELQARLAIMAGEMDRALSFMQRTFRLSTVEAGA